MSDQIKEDKVVEIVIDFNEIRGQELNESYLRMFGSWVKTILDSMFRGTNVPLKIVGSKRDVETFATAVGREKRHIEAINRYGLNDRRTYQSKSRLDSAVRAFQNTTGLKWPFK